MIMATRKRHSPKAPLDPGNLPPVEYEQAHYAALNREPQPV